MFSQRLKPTFRSFRLDGSRIFRREAKDVLPSFDVVRCYDQSPRENSSDASFVKRS
jgi:hypothetical protein